MEILRKAGKVAVEVVVVAGGFVLGAMCVKAVTDKQLLEAEKERDLLSDGTDPEDIPFEENNKEETEEGDDAA